MFSAIPVDLYMVSESVSRSLQIALTGGIGSGKSLASRMLERMGARILDTDVISAQLTAANGAAVGHIGAEFGAAYIGESGMQRSLMRELVFHDHTARQRLENILHPLILERIHQLLNVDDDRWLIVIVVPLLVERWEAWGYLSSRIVVVDCDATTQLHRLSVRPDITPDMARAILQTQSCREVRLERASDIVVNDARTSIQEFFAQLSLLFRRWRQLHLLDCMR